MVRKNLKAWWSARQGCLTFVSSKVSVCGDRRTWPTAGKNLSQGFSARRPAFTAANSSCGNMPTMDFDGTTHSIKAATASDWTFLHDGTGMTVMVAFRIGAAMPAVYGIILETSAGLTGAGINMLVYANGRYQLLIEGDTGLASVVVNTLVTNQFAVNTTYVVTATYVEGASPEWTMRVNAVQVGSGNSLIAPGTGAPGNAVEIGGFATANVLGMSMGAGAIWSRALATAELVECERNLGRDVGLSL